MSGDLEKFEKIAKLTHKEQAIWVLNGFWGKLEKEAENFWKWVQKYNELDLKKKADGCELDELNAHVFLEKMNETLTVKELRDKLREIGYVRKPMMFPLVDFIMIRYKLDWHQLVNAPQGDNAAEIAAAQAALDAAIAAVDAAIKAADDAKKAAEAAAVAQKEAEVAKAEMEKAVAEVHAQEEARDKKTKDLEAKSEQGGAVTRNKAKAELAAHLAEDPLPLRKAKITLQAADRKAAKTLKAATEAREAAEAAAIEAEKAVGVAEEEMKKCQAKLEEVKMAGGGGQGALWYMDRELEEKRKYMPSSKRGKM